MQTSLHAAIESNVAVTETDFREELKKIDVPTLIVQGNCGQVMPAGDDGEADGGIDSGE